MRKTKPSSIFSGQSISERPPLIEQLSLASLRPSPRNARTHSKKQIRQLKDSIQQFGQIKPVIADDNNVILAGHGFVEAARLAGLKKVSVLRFGHLTEAQKRAYLLADNRIAEQAGWDREILSLELGELAELLPVEGLDVSLTGFDTGEIDLLLGDMSSDREEPENLLPSVSQHPITRRGELWLLDKHRLLCADAQNADSFELLMDGVSAAAVFCDPPYNLRASDIGGRGQVKHADFAFGAGEMTPARFRDFLARTLGHGIAFSTSGAVHFICMDWRHIADLIEVGNKLYDAMLNLVVWNKSNAGQGSFYRSQHELIGVFRAGQDPHQNNIELGRFGRNRSNVWTYAGVNTFGRDRMKALSNHPTVKPVAMVADALLDCTNRGDVILDQFAGSGTILAAADKVGRIAYAMEYEPRYVDVAIQRWQALTKREATLAGDGRTYQEIADVRTDPSVGPQSNSLDTAEKASRAIGGPTKPAGARKARANSRSGHA